MPSKNKTLDCPRNLKHPTVLLVIRSSDGEVRWMDVRDWLKRASDNAKKQLKQIVFTGERFDVMSVRRWRERVLKDKSN
jgi:hypothetical protein